MDKKLVFVTRHYKKRWLSVDFFLFDICRFILININWINSQKSWKPILRTFIFQALCVCQSYILAGSFQFIILGGWIAFSFCEETFYLPSCNDFLVRDYRSLLLSLCPPLMWSHLSLTGSHPLSISSCEWWS